MSSNTPDYLYAIPTLESTTTDTINSSGYIDIMSRNPPIGDVQPLYLFSIDDLINNQEFIQQQEDEDRTKLQSFISPSYEQLKPILLQWAKQGFPPVYTVNTLKLYAPSTCSDGQSRAFPLYIEYLLNRTMESWLVELSSKSNGITFTFSHNGGNTINLHVSRG